MIYETIILILLCARDEVVTEKNTIIVYFRRYKSGVEHNLNFSKNGKSLILLQLSLLKIVLTVKLPFAVISSIKLNQQEHQEIYQCNSSSVLFSLIKIYFESKKIIQWSVLTAASKVSSRNELLRKLTLMVIARRAWYVMYILTACTLKIILDFYGFHQTVTIFLIFKSKHVPRLSLATQGGDSVVRDVRDDRSSRGKKTTECLCADAFIARYGWTISGRGYVVRHMRRGELENGGPTSASCAIARVEQPPTFARNFTRERELVREWNQKGARFKGGEDGDVSSSRLFANFSNIRSSSVLRPLYARAVAMNRLSHP